MSCFWDPIVKQNTPVAMYNGNEHGAYVSSFWMVDDVVFFEYMAQVNTGAYGKSNNPIRVSLPVACHQDYVNYNIAFGLAEVVDSSDASRTYPLTCRAYSATEMQFSRQDVLVAGASRFGTIAGGGVILAQNDQIRAVGHYRFGEV